MRIKDAKKIHLTGIKGVGMAALALYLSDMGIEVAGSDVAEVFVTDEVLKRKGINWKVGINKDNIAKDIDLLITTGAHGGLENEEVKFAKKRGIKVLTYAEALAEVSLEKETICVCGVGGKTTISSMLSVLLDSASLQPSFIVGVGNIYPLGVPGRYLPDGKNFICEADEYVVSPGIDNRPKFSLLSPKIVVVTNIEYDHPDVYESFEKTKSVFRNFFEKIPKFGHLVANADNKNTLSVVNQLGEKVFTYGFSPSADYRIINLRFNEQKTIFDVAYKKNKCLVKDLCINVPGRHNVSNALAALVVGRILEISEESLRDGLERYLGCRRRFEDMGIFLGARFFDDYAHHPNEIQVILKAAREWFPKKRIIAVFQPHTYSRTKALFDKFSKCFTKADIVCLTDIYSSAREKYDPTINSKMLAEKISHFKKSFYTGDLDKTFRWLTKNIKKGDIVITLGAGNIFYLYEKIKKEKIRKS